MKAPEFIVERSVLMVSPEGQETLAFMRIGAPSVGPDGIWNCSVDTGVDERVTSIFGEDSWQAMELAMWFCVERAKARADQGWTFLWPDSRDPYTFG